MMWLIIIYLPLQPTVPTAYCLQYLPTAYSPYLQPTVPILEKLLNQNLSAWKHGILVGIYNNMCCTVATICMWFLFISKLIICKIYLVFNTYIIDIL